MAQPISLSANVRANLLALQSTASQLATSQGRLATGLKVNSSIDNPASFFTAQGLNSRASTLTTLGDGIASGIQTVKAAGKGLDSIGSAVDSLKGLINQVKSDAGSITNSAVGTVVTNNAAALGGTAGTNGALGLTDNQTLILTNSTTNVATTISVGTVAGKTVQDLLNQINTSTNGAYTASLNNGNIQISNSSGSQFTIGGTGATKILGTTTASTNNTVDQSKLNSYAKQFNELLTSIQQTAKDSGYNGTNLLDAAASLQVNFNEDGTSSTTLQGKDVTASTFGFAAVSETASSVSSFLSQLTAVTTAGSTIKQYSSEFNTKLTIMQNRSDFSKNITDILKTGASGLTNADQNEEAANVLALQTRQSLSQSALSLANQADQAVLQLLR